MTEKLEVIQADRQAAADLITTWRGDGFRSGHHDQAVKGLMDGTALVQAFARHRLSHSGEREALIEALEPVKHWYQSDEHEERPLAAIVADLVADVQHDRPLALQAEKLREALNDLVSWFPEKPTDPEWRLQGGKWGADDAVAHARSTLSTMRNNGNG